jgi:hypothetical protein
LHLKNKRNGRSGFDAPKNAFSHSLAPEAVLKNIARGKDVYGFQSTGVCGSLEVISLRLACLLISQTAMGVLV